MPSDVTLMPYMQKVLSDFLRGELGGIRVVSDPPDEDRRDTPWVQVIQLPAEHNENDPVDRLVSFYMQLSCYAGEKGGKPEAERLARRCAALVTQAFSGVYAAPTPEDDPVAVSCARIASGPSSAPDDTAFEPARDRFVLDTIVYAHTVRR